MMTYQARKGAFSLEFFSSPFHRVSGGIGSIFSSLGGFLGNLTGGADVRALKDRVAALERERAALAGVQRENERLKALLGLKDENPRYVAAANVVSRGSKRWANTFIIDAGRAQGVEKDMAVVTPAGLVGKVARADEGYSTVLLASDVRFSVAVRIDRTRAEAILSGTGSRACALKYFPYDQPVQTGDVLVTSGLDGLFPEGVRAGVVSKLGPEEGLFRSVEVMPFADASSTEEVAIIRR